MHAQNAPKLISGTLKYQYFAVYKDSPLNGREEGKGVVEGTAVGEKGEEGKEERCDGGNKTGIGEVGPRF